MAAAAGTVKTNLKLLIDKKAKRVVFAEADKAFLDFLCGILSVPINTIVSVFKEKGMMLGSLGNLYKSIDALGQEYMTPPIKDDVFKPRAIVQVPLLSVCDAPPTLNFYGCSSHMYFTHSPHELCPYSSSCRGTMSALSYKYVAPKKHASGSTGSTGYVKEVVKYMVLDNLEVKPLTIAQIKCHADDIASLEERDVEVGYDEGLALLKASFETQAVLTAVFLGTKDDEDLTCTRSTDFISAEDQSFLDNY